MKIDIVKRRAKRILAMDKISKHDIRWFNSQVDRYREVQESWEVNLDKDIPLQNRQPKTKGRILSDDDCYAIRSGYMRGDMTQKELASDYGVSVKTIQKALYPEKTQQKVA
tara:strand:- start:2733 stop:3065 length:333 start_codon:yes stop_codon:yes gene_type:complete